MKLQQILAILMARYRLLLVTLLITVGKGTIEDWLAAGLLRKLDVKPSRESSVINLSFSGFDPRFVAVIANAFAQAYIDLTLQLKTEPARQTAAWFDDQTRTLRGNLEVAQARLTQFQRDNGIVATDERLDVENARLSELSTQLVVTQSQMHEALSRQRQIADFATRGTLPDSIPEVVMNPLVSGLKSELSRMEAKLKDIASQLGAAHPQYQRLTQEIESMRGKLNEEMKTVLSSVGNSANITQRREVELRTSLAAQKAKVLEIKRQRDELAVITRDVESAQRSYDAALGRFTTTRMESQANQTNVVLLTPAVEPIEHSSPKIVLNTVLAVLLGLMLGVGAALIAEMMDYRLRSGDDVSQGLGVPLLGDLGDARKQMPRRWFGRARTVSAGASA